VILLYGYDRTIRTSKSVHKNPATDRFSISAGNSSFDNILSLGSGDIW